MESVAAARMRLHFQSVGTTAGLPQNKSTVRAHLILVERSGLYTVAKNRVSKK